MALAAKLSVCMFVYITVIVRLSLPCCPMLSAKQLFKVTASDLSCLKLPVLSDKAESLPLIMRT